MNIFGFQPRYRTVDANPPTFNPTHAARPKDEGLLKKMKGYQLAMVRAARVGVVVGALALAPSPGVAQLNGCYSGSLPSGNYRNILVAQKDIRRLCVSMGMSQGQANVVFFNSKLGQFYEAGGTSYAIVVCAKTAANLVQVHCTSGPCNFCWQVTRE